MFLSGMKMSLVKQTEVPGIHAYSKKCNSNKQKMKDTTKLFSLPISGKADVLG